MPTSKMLDLRKKPSENITVPIKPPPDVAKSEESEEIDRTIERLRTEFVAREKRREMDEKALRKFDSANRNQTADGAQKVRYIGWKYKKHTMNMSGEVIPLIPFPIHKCKAVQPIIKAKIVDGTVNDTITNLSSVEKPHIEEFAMEENKEEAPAREDQNVVSEAVTMGYKAADVSKIEPSFGVTLKGAEGVKRGPSVLDDPNLMTRAGFHKGKDTSLGQGNRKSEFRKVATAQDGNRAKINKSQLNGANNDNSNLMRNDDSNAYIFENMLVRQNQASIFYAKPNKTFTGSIPTRTVSYVKYKREVSTPYKKERKKDEKVIVQKADLAKYMEFIEENAIRRVATANSNTVYKQQPRSSEGRKIRERSPPLTSHSKYRMAPPPIGKTIGHGILRPMKL